ncbi:MAG: ABC transporter ATP-binding protein [Anaerolineae bacterium]
MRTQRLQKQSRTVYRDDRAQLSANSRNSRIKNTRQKEEVLERVGLSKRATSRIRTLSGVCAAGWPALLHDPEVLILDEPTIGLDPIQVLEIRDVVRQLRQAHTVLFSTHILSEAEQVCDNLVIINQGTIVAEGSPAQLRSELERGGRILLRADGPVENIMEALRTIPTVAHVEQTIEGIVATPRDANVDPRPEIAQMVVQNNWRLIELRPLAVNLEEIFLELTRQTAAPVEEEKAKPEAEGDTGSMESEEANS